MSDAEDVRRERLVDKGAVGGATNEATVSSPTRAQWRKFRELVFEPWTAVLLAVSLTLFVVGQQGLTGGVNALVQLLLAVATGVLGARVTNLVAEASGQGILSARGKVAVRGLSLMLVQTAAFERRLHRFLAKTDHIRTKPEVTERNYEEAIEFCKRIQEAAASAMETWGDIVPTADLSSLIGRITEAEEQRDSTRSALKAVQEDLVKAEGNAAESVRLRERVELLEVQVSDSEKRVAVLNHRLSRRAMTDASPANGVSRELRFRRSFPSKNESEEDRAARALAARSSV